MSESESAYYKVQVGECKVLANSFYRTAPHPCGPMISGHGSFRVGQKGQIGIRKQQLSELSRRQKDDLDLWTMSVKVKDLVAFKSVRSPSDSVLMETFGA
ncbi:hypothetical protein CRENBAI_010610 [Crenichthys baileyi]|uniref:Uncharacterized protein n=1 Tax=Crenichthys baileyi TaxID=28760 RepID=A0AAV9QWP9_9TELE